MHLKSHNFDEIQDVKCKNVVNAKGVRTIKFTLKIDLDYKKKWFEDKSIKT